MTKFYPIVALSLFACTEAPVPSDAIEQIGQIEQTLCDNTDGTPSAMAALAVATANELSRWQPTKDFIVNRGQLELTTAGKRRCDDGRCWNTQAILDLQRAPSGTVVLGDTSFDGELFRSELETNFRQQLRCESQRDERGQDSCQAERHELTLDSVASGACDTVYTYHATSPDGSPLSKPERLANKLIFVGYPENEYLSFTSTGKTVSIDPTYGLNPSDGTGTGSCTAACTKISSTNISGDCCICNGETRSFARSAFSTSVYLCQ
jgi:hypothetical protein